LQRDIDDQIADVIRQVPTHFALTNVSSGCTKTLKVLNATNQEATLWVAGQAKVGINIFSVTGTNTFTFLASQDGLQFNPFSVATYPAAQAPGFQVASVPTQSNLPSSAIQQAIAGGTWEAGVGNYQFIRVQMTSGNGPASIIMAASVDGSYQEAFNTPTNLGVSMGVVYPSTTSSAGVNTMAIPARPNASINLTYLDVQLVGPGFGGNAMLRVWDGAIGTNVPLWQGFPPSPVGSVGTDWTPTLPKDSQGNTGIQGTPGNAMNIQIINLGNTFAVMNARYTYM
jgi:hypothetical protein